MRVLLAQADARDGLTLAEAVDMTLAGDLPPSDTGLASPAAAVSPGLVARVVAPRACRVAFAGMPVSEPARVEVYAWLERLGALTAPMTAGQVLIEAVDRGHQEPRYRVRMDLTMPTGVVVVDYDHPSNRPHEDLYVAIRNAFRAARRELDALREASGPLASEEGA